MRRQLLAMCASGTAQELERRRARSGDAEQAALLQRLLDVVQAAVRRMLDDQPGLRLAAAERNTTYLAVRLRVLDFLDVTADALTAQDLTEFLQPRIARWDVDLESGVLRVVLRGQDPGERSSRRGRRKDGL